MTVWIYGGMYTIVLWLAVVVDQHLFHGAQPIVTSAALLVSVWMSIAQPKLTENKLVALMLFKTSLGAVLWQTGIYPRFDFDHSSKLMAFGMISFFMVLAAKQLTSDWHEPRIKIAEEIGHQGSYSLSIMDMRADRQSMYISCIGSFGLQVTHSHWIGLATIVCLAIQVVCESLIERDIIATTS